MIGESVVVVCRIGAAYYAGVSFGQSLPGFVRDRSNQSKQRIEPNFLIRVSDGSLTIPKWQGMWKIENNIKYEHSYVYRVKETLAIFTVIQNFWKSCSGSIFNRIRQLVPTARKEDHHVMTRRDMF